MLASKGGFFSESAMCFLDLQISKNFKLRIVFWNIFFFWRFADLENESNFLKRSHLYTELKGFQEWLYEFISLKILAWKAIKCSSCLKKCFRSHFFIVFFSTFSKKLVPSKGRFGQKTHEIWTLKTCPIQKWQAMRSPDQCNGLIQPPHCVLK